MKIVLAKTVQNTKELKKMANCAGQIYVEKERRYYHQVNASSAKIMNSFKKI
jgi:hypothetical protein